MTSIIGPAVAGAYETIQPIAVQRDIGRTGGWFECWRHVRQARGAVPASAFALGFVEQARFRRYQDFAAEKPARLSLQPTDHVSSWQSRDVDNERYGGAIRCGIEDKLLFSFSGFLEQEDEAICVLAALELGLIDMARASKIAAASNNSLLISLLQS